jgi:hypothetical protein
VHFVAHTLAAIALTGALITSAAAGPSGTDAAGLLQMGPAEIRQYGGKRLEHEIGFQLGLCRR